MNNRTDHHSAAPDTSHPASIPGGMTRRTELALGILEQVRREVARKNPADASLQAIFRKHREYGSRDRRFYSSVVFSYFRWLGWIRDVEIVKACATALLLDASEWNGDLKTFCADAGFSDADIKPLAPLTLEEKAEAAGHLLEREVTPEEILPPGILDRIAWSQEARAVFLASMQIRPPTWLRFMNAADASAFTSAEGTLHPRIPTALALPQNFNRGLLSTPEGRKADVQDLSSQCVGLIAAPQPHERWWDACSGSGGKALHLAALAGGRAEILASDIRAASLDQIRERAARTGMRGIRTALLDSAEGHPDGESFDGIIVDAPCSGIGTWPRNPDARWRFDPVDIAKSSVAQTSILRNVSRFLKPGGRLIYSVCTCTVDETSSVVESFLSANRDFEPMDFIHPLTGAVCPGQCMIRPADGPGNGLFIAMIRKSEQASTSI